MRFLRSVKRWGVLKPCEVGLNVDVERSSLVRIH